MIFEYTDDVPSDADSIGELGEDEFVAKGVDGELVDPDEAILDHENGEYQLIFDVTVDDGPFVADGDDAFGENQEATLDIVAPSSSVTTVELNAPSLFQDEGEAVRL